MVDTFAMIAEDPRVAERANRSREFRFDFHYLATRVLTLVYYWTCQLCLSFHLSLPSLYRSRVDQLLKETNLTFKDIAVLVARFETPKHGHTLFDYDPLIPASAAYPRLKSHWEGLINDFVGEWSTLNIVSAVLIPGILTLLQTDGAANDPVTRSLTFWSLLLGIWSLIHSSLYIIQFSRLRKMHVFLMWAEEVESHDTLLWNLWIMLALPAIWLWWSILIFVFAIVWFMWRTNANLPQDFTFSTTPSTELGLRITISTVLGIMICYLVLALERLNGYNRQMTILRDRHVEKPKGGDINPEGTSGGGAWSSQQPPVQSEAFMPLSSPPSQMDDPYIMDQRFL